MSYDGRGRRDVGGLWLIVAYTLGWFCLLLVVAAAYITMVVGDMVARFGADKAMWRDGFHRMQLGDLSAVPSWTMAASLVVQFPGMLLLIFIVHRLVDWLFYRRRPQLVSRPGGWSEAFAWRPTSWVYFPGAVVIGFTVGMLPGWIAEQLKPFFSDSSSTIDAINDALTKGPLPSRLVMILFVALIGPVVEELVFRGFMWDALRRFSSPFWAMVGTSLLFAAYHMDPRQSFALLITAFTLGWLRWISGSIWPGVVVHIVNNSLGVAAAYVALDSSTAASITTAGISLSVAALLGLYRLSRTGSLASDLSPFA